MKILFFIVSVVQCCFGLYGEGFDHQYNKRSYEKVGKLKVIGERCSGTNFLEHLMRKNFPSLKGVHDLEFGQKHFLWWFGTPVHEHDLKRLTYNWDAVYLTNSQDCLFLYIVRDPYDWLRSFYSKPHNVANSLIKGDFFHFITHQWKVSRDRIPPGHGDYEVIDNLNPYTNAPFKNVLELRGCKINNYLKVKDLVMNFCFIRYEDLDQDPQRFVAFIENYYGLEKTENFIPIVKHQGIGRRYVKKTYFPFKPHELELINNSLDWEVENKVGYRLKEEQ